jgi:CCR4-NOT complex subunit CAF16
MDNTPKKNNLKLAEIVNVKKMFFDYFDKKILNNIDISVNEGDKILLIGANGAGKSTLLRVLSGFHIPKSYDYFNILGSNSPNDQFNGLAYLGNKWSRNISFCGTAPYTADIKAGEMMKQWQEDNIERRNELVKILNINLEWKMNKVSDGERKRVQILLALLKPFKLLIIDEFLYELDIVIRDRFFKYLDKECQLRKSAIIYATHIFDNLDKWANNVIYISNGKCDDKINISKFDINNNLYLSVKEKLANDYKYTLIKTNIDPLKYGPQYGYSSGRLSFKKFDLQ